MEQRQLLIAHRAGNDLSELPQAEDAGADLVELDVHLRRAQLTWPVATMHDVSAG